MSLAPTKATFEFEFVPRTSTSIPGIVVAAHRHQTKHKSSE